MPDTPPPTNEKKEAEKEFITDKALTFKQELISELNTRCENYIYSVKDGNRMSSCERYENPRDVKFLTHVNNMSPEELFNLGKTSIAGELKKPFSVTIAREKIYEMIDADGGKKKSRRKPRKLNKKKSIRKKSRKRKRRTRK